MIYLERRGVLDRPPSRTMTTCYVDRRSEENNTDKAANTK
jgi:hypothetical protein